MIREYLAYVEKILQASSYLESQQQLRKVQEARIKFRDEVSALEKVCKSDIPELDPPGTAANKPIGGTLKQRRSMMIPIHYCPVISRINSTGYRGALFRFGDEFP